MHTWQLLPRGLDRAFTIILVLATLLALIAPAAAQDDDPDALVEALALAAHQQNLRMYSYTAWIGGPLGDPAYAPRRSVVGDRLENVTLASLTGDENIDLSTRERPVLLNFWASWCPPCRAEFPYLAEVALHPEDYAFDVLFVNMSDTVQDARAFLADYPEDLPTAFDQNDRLALRASVDSIPTSILLDTDGTVLLAHTGTITPTISAFIDAVATYPGAGVFVGADHMDEPVSAVLAPINREDTPLLVPGTVAQGELDDTTFQQAYHFTGQTGDVATLTLEANNDDLDPYLVLMTADGVRLGENDDIETGVIIDSALTVTLPADGVYLAVATRFLEAEGFGSGPYTLTLALDPADTTAAAAAPAAATGAATAITATGTASTMQQDELRKLSYGDTVTATISDAEYEQRWSFEGATDDVITIEMARTIDEAGELDGYLLLIGPDDTTLIEVDDTDNAVMPVIANYTLPASGTYTIVATRFGFASGFSTGEYTLALRLDEVLPLTEAGPDWLPSDTLPADLRLINYNETVTGTLDDNNIDDWYTFQGNQGDVISITMQPATADDFGFDPFLILTTASGEELALNDDADTGNEINSETDSETTPVDAAITDFTLPATDTYLIRATRYGFENGPSHGNYELTVAAFTTEPLTTSLTTLAYGDTATGDLSFDSPIDRYAFDGHVGEQVTIRIAGNATLHPVLILRGPDGNTLISDINSAGMTETVLLRVPLPVNGTYTVEVISKELNTSGTYTLLLLGHTIPTIDPGAFVPAPDVDLEAVLIWASGTDLDLQYSGPENAAAPLRSAANDLCQDTLSTPVERFTWATGSAEPGNYAITVAYRSNCTAQTEPVTFILALARNGEVIDLIGGTLAREGDLYTTRITYDR